MKQNLPRHCTKCGSQLESKIENGKKRICCHNCDTVYYDNPIPGVAVVTRNEKGQLPLIKKRREAKRGCWTLPGGLLDDGESAIQAALRKLFEDTGLKGIVKRFVKIFNHESEAYGEVKVITYEVGITGGQLKAGENTESVNFFDLEELPPLAFSFQTEAVEQVFGCSLSKTSEN